MEWVLIYFYSKHLKCDKTSHFLTANVEFSQNTYNLAHLKTTAVGASIQKTVEAW